MPTQLKLNLMWHAHNCQKPKNYYPSQNANKCSMPRCGSTKLVLNHMKNCKEMKNCPVNDCLSSRHIINHWGSSCNKSDCSMCDVQSTTKASKYVFFKYLN